MVLEAVEKVVNSDTFLTMFNINEDLWPIIKKSWQNKQMDF
jgi:glutathionylspermidine synthase